jgi:hypothetical protein
MQHFRTLALTIASLFLFSGTATALEIPPQKDPAADLVLQSLMECGRQKLGGENGVELAKQMGDQANRQIVAYCKEGNKQKAREVAQYYATTDEGTAALDCAAQIKPLVDQPAVQKLLGNYKDMVNEVMSGQVPQDVCVGIRQEYRRY